MRDVVLGLAENPALPERLPRDDPHFSVVWSQAARTPVGRVPPDAVEACR
ncbi:hypothetical protein ACFC0D_14300 [Streptomyces sp. NPDC056222]